MVLRPRQKSLRRGLAAERIWSCLLLVAALVTHVSSHAGINNDSVLRFSTAGTDCYIDGSPVEDGECYALVWSPKGSAFKGFNADGTAVSDRDRVVLAAPLAKDGRCRDTLFQISGEEYAALKDGVWAVCLVDTRRADGVPAGVGADGLPGRVNRWGLVSGGVEISPALAGDTSAGAAASLAAALSAAASGGSSVRVAKSGARVRTYGVCARETSAVPDYAPVPRITAFDIADGVARLTVSGTVPYLSYGIASGPRPGELESDPYAAVSDGESGAEIELTADARGAARFFRVERAE